MGFWGPRVDISPKKRGQKHSSKLSHGTSTILMVELLGKNRRNSIAMFVYRRITPVTIYFRPCDMGFKNPYITPFNSRRQFVPAEASMMMMSFTKSFGLASLLLGKHSARRVTGLSFWGDY